MLAARNFTSATVVRMRPGARSAVCVASCAVYGRRTWSTTTTFRSSIHDMHTDHICHPENDRRRCQVLAADSRLLNTSELREAAANLEAVTDITPDMLEALHRHELEGWHREMALRKKLGAKLEAWYQLWKEEMLERHIAVQRQAVLDWARVRRGSDLFVRGLGRFNIDVAVCKSLADVFAQPRQIWGYDYCKSFYTIHLHSESTSARAEQERTLKYHHTWVLRPQDVQARGHFPALDTGWIRFSGLQPLTRVGWLLALPDDHPIRRHLIRFHAYWARPDNASTLHELVEAGEALSVAHVQQVGPQRRALLSEAGVTSMIGLAHLDDDQQARIAESCAANNRSLSKRVLRTLVQNAAAELPRRWAAELNAGAQPITLLRRLRELETTRLAGPEVHFAHLDSLADGPINAHGEQMQVLRSKHAIIQTAKRLRNCAAGYATRVKKNQYVLVSLVDTRTGAPKALGGVAVVLKLGASIPCEFGESGPNWHQIVEQSNEAPSLATQTAFANFVFQYGRET